MGECVKMTLWSQMGANGLDTEFYLQRSRKCPDFLIGMVREGT